MFSRRRGGTADTAPTSLHQALASQRLRRLNDGLVFWRDDNLDHPRNWTRFHKAYGISIVIFLDFFTTTVGAAGVAIAEEARMKYDVSSAQSLAAFTSTYLFGQGLGSVVFPPYSESFGRKKLYIVSTFLYGVCCFIIAAIDSLPVAVILRFLTGVFSSVPTIVVAGSIEDQFDIRNRVWLVFAWLTVANLGLVVGTIGGAYIVIDIGFRWVFWIAGIVTTTSAFLLIFMRESRPSYLLEQQVAVLRKATGMMDLRAKNPDSRPPLKELIVSIFIRPIILFREPIVLMVSVMSAIAFGLVYLFMEAIPVVYSAYGFSSKRGTLAFLPIGAGLCFGILTQLYTLRLIDRKTAQGQSIEPEDKLVGFAIAAPLLAVSLWIFAWTTPPALHGTGAIWIISMLALIPLGFAVNEFDCVLAGYMADSYTVYAASAFASLSILRSTCSALFPLFGHRMFTSLGSNIATSILAAIATFATALPFLFIKYGARIRRASRFATYSAEVHRANSVGISDLVILPSPKTDGVTTITITTQESRALA